MKTVKSLPARVFAPLAMCLALLSCGGKGETPQIISQWTSVENPQETVNAAEIEVGAGQKYIGGGDCTNFVLQGQALADSAAEAAVLFHNDGKDGGYEMLIHNGASDGTRKTGSLSTVRNLYHSLADSGKWFDFSIAVRGKNISIAINGTEVVCYTEPEEPYRLPQYAKRLLGHGKFALAGYKGTVKFRDMKLTRLGADAVNPNDTMPPVDEQKDGAIRLQQQNFPVIDYHVHLKGGLTLEMARAKSMNYGIDYGISINLGEGGIGTMLPDDSAATAYCKEMKSVPFLLGAQGEGRRWIAKFTRPVLDGFDYLFTDALTIVDKGRICRIYRPEEVRLDGRTKEQYMDMLVDQIVKILTNEPVDFYANPTFLPEIMQDEYDKYWTEARINRVLDVLQKNGIALEINSRYRLPSYKIIRMAKERGLKFTFGTNNETPDFGRSEYAIGAVEKCGLTAGDIWFPTMSCKSGRKTVDYNHIGDPKAAPVPIAELENKKN